MLTLYFIELLATVSVLLDKATSGESEEKQQLHDPYSFL
jgi:hypothetical protein